MLLVIKGYLGNNFLLQNPIYLHRDNITKRETAFVACISCDTIHPGVIAIINVLSIEIKINVNLIYPYTIRPLYILNNILSYYITSLMNKI